MKTRLRTLVYMLGAICLLASVALAQEEAGQEDLDKATELRLSAKSPQDYQRVAALCDSAINKGLSKENQEFAKQLAAGAMFDLSSRLASMVLDTPNRDARWQLFRHTALQSLEKAIEYDPELAEAHLMIGRLQQMPGGKKARALTAAKKSIELFEKTKNKSQLSKAYLLRGQLGSETKDRLADFAKALEFDPSNADAMEGQARLLMADGKADEALKVFDKLLKSSDDKIGIRLTIAEALAGLERFDDALEQVGKALEADDRNSKAYTLRARINAMRDDAKGALEDLNKALEVDPQNLTALLIRCELHMVEKQFDKARADVKSLLAARPGLALGYQLRSRIAAAEGQDAKDAEKKTLARMKFAEAARDLRLLLRHEPNNFEWRMQLASIYSTDDQPRRAIKEIEKVLQKDEDNWIAHRTRGDALLSIGEHKKAVSDYEIALKQRPKNSGILNNLAWVLSTSPKDDVRKGKRAVELALKACEATEYKQAHILSTLASGYAEIGDFEMARKWAAKAVELGEDDLKDQLQKELDSYNEEKPWRELQETKENPDFEEPSGDVVDT